MNGPPRYPDLSAWVPLDRAHVRTAAMEVNAARLVLAERVTFLPEWASAVSFPFLVHGDSRDYLCWVQPYRQDPDGTWLPWYTTCSRGGDHDRTPARSACKHMLAAAVELALHVRPQLGVALEHEQAPGAERAATARSGVRADGAGQPRPPSTGPSTSPPRAHSSRVAGGDDAPSATRAATRRRLVEDDRQPGVVREVPGGSP
jgi:hypothetical protein